jgi:hypothetical protein
MRVGIRRSHRPRTENTRAKGGGADRHGEHRELQIEGHKVVAMVVHLQNQTRAHTRADNPTRARGVTLVHTCIVMISCFASMLDCI